MEVDAVDEVNLEGLQKDLEGLKVEELIADCENEKAPTNEMTVTQR